MSQTPYPTGLPDATASGASKASVGCAAGCGCLTLGFVGLSVAGFATGELGLAIPFAIFGTIGLAILIGLLATARRDAMVDVQVTISPLQARFGERVRVDVQVLAKRRVRLTTGKIALRCRERAINRGGTSDTTYYHLAHDDVREITAETELSEGMAWNTSESFEIPLGLPASFDGRNNYIEWHAHVDLGIKGPTLDIRGDHSFEVLPETA